MEKDTMIQKPRPFTTAFFSWKELTTSIIQGLAISAGAIFIFQYSIFRGYSESITRTMVFFVLISANIFLTLVNRSFYYSIFTTLKYKNNLVLIIISITVVISGLLLFVKPLTKFFEFETLNLYQLSGSFGIGFLFVIWYEVIKWRKRTKNSIQS